MMATLPKDGKHLGPREVAAKFGMLKFFFGDTLTNDELEIMHQGRSHEQPRMTGLPETSWKAMPADSASGDK